ncbi:MAG: mechanosensitive ion channel family protein [Planctomycetota bacterium]|jgi:small-conductance mechanosensitive channel
MDWMKVLPLGVVVALLVCAVLAVRLALRGDQRRFARTITLTAVWLIGLLAITLELPIEHELRGQLVSLVGVLLSASIALGATVLISHGLSGVALKVEKTFRSGDFIEIGGHTGRVTHRGVLYTEVQTETRDLLRLPNHYLITTPVRVVQKSGTIITASVGLGYDTPAPKIDALLVEAVEAAGLEDPFVLIDELGDYAVTVRCGGLLKDTKQIISARSNLRRNLLRSLHGAGIEIASPTLMNTRVFDTDYKFIWTPPREQAPTPEGTPESIAFDKADRAESAERLGDLIAQAEARLADLRKAHGDAADEEKEKLAARIAETEKRIEKLKERESETKD